MNDARETHDDILESILEFGGAAADLAALMWPHLTPEERIETIYAGAGDPWAMAASTLAIYPVRVLVPEDILAAVEEEAKGYLAEHQPDPYAELALIGIERHRESRASLVARSDTAAESEA